MINIFKISPYEGKQITRKVLSTYLVPTRTAFQHTLQLQLPLFTISYSLVLRWELSNIPMISCERDGSVILIAAHYLSGTVPVALL